MIDLSGKNVGLTGAKGFIGKYVNQVLKKRDATVFNFEDKLPAVSQIRSAHDILKDSKKCCDYLNKHKIDYVIHLAGYNGGIEFNRQFPADIFAINTILGINIISACANTQQQRPNQRNQTKVKKLLSVITSCSYPDGMDLMQEKELHSGAPGDIVSCHGYAKRNVEIASRMYRKQYKLNAITVCPNTVYGPGDRLDPNRTKVMTALIKKFVDAKNENLDQVVCWGTGLPKREFIYVQDTAELLVRTLENYEEEIPLNISTGQEYTIKDLSEIIASIVGYEGKIYWDTSKQDGAMRKRLDVTRMPKFLGEYDFTPIEKGIRNTYEWYRHGVEAASRSI